MYTGNNMIDSTLPDYFDEDQEPEWDEYEPEEEINDN
jgi:hypothetical protein